jgi:thiosulfate/3-mercaptopyruvate sulfurtransferase
VNSPFVSASLLAEQLAGPSGPVVLDASFVLHSAEFDGDYRRDSGYPRWLHGHVPGSRHVDIASQFSDPAAPLHFSHPEPQAIADELARLGISEGSPVVVYDSTGTLWAARLWFLLRWIGVDVHVLDGGLAAWRDAGLPVESGDGTGTFGTDTGGTDTLVPDTGGTGNGGVRPAAVPWVARPQRNPWVDVDELASRASADVRPLVCGLGHGAFAGAEPTRYSRRGRIPGSLNVPGRALFEPDGTVKARAEIAFAYTTAGVDVGAAAPEVLLYCGGGISAAANALTLAEIGVTNVRIYDGSLEEWSANPELPLTVD